MVQGQKGVQSTNKPDDEDTSPKPKTKGSPEVKTDGVEPEPVTSINEGPCVNTREVYV